MSESPLWRSRRQKIVSETENKLAPEVEQLQTLSRDELALLQLIVLKELTSASSLSSASMLEPSRVEEGLEGLKEAGLVTERQMGSSRIVEPTPVSRRLRRAIAAME